MRCTRQRTGFPWNTPGRCQLKLFGSKAETSTQFYRGRGLVLAELTGLSLFLGGGKLVSATPAWSVVALRDNPSASGCAPLGRQRLLAML